MRLFSPYSHLAQRGFTLIELMVSVAILGLLASLAAPNFSEAIRRYRINAIREELAASLQLARVEAIRRGVPVSLSRVSNCSGVSLVGTTDWSCGWEVFVDANSNGVKNSTELILQTSSVPVGYGVLHAGQGNSILQFNVWGQATGVGHSFVLTPPEGVAGASTTTLCLNAGGRMRKLTGGTTCT